MCDVRSTERCRRAARSLLLNLVSLRRSGLPKYRTAPSGVEVLSLWYYTVPLLWYSFLLLIHGGGTRCTCLVDCRPPTTLYSVRRCRSYSPTLLYCVTWAGRQAPRLGLPSSLPSIPPCRRNRRDGHPLTLASRTSERPPAPGSNTTTLPCERKDTAILTYIYLRKSMQEGFVVTPQSS